MVAKKKPVRTAKSSKPAASKKRRSPKTQKNDFHPTEASLAVATGAAVILVVLALATAV